MASRLLAPALALAALVLTLHARAQDAGSASPQVLKERRGRLLAELGEGSLLVLGSATSSRLTGDKDFYYLTGLRSDPGVLVAIHREGKVVETLFLPPRDAERERWDDAILYPGPEASERTGIPTLPVTELEPTLIAVRAQARTVWFSPTGLEGSRSLPVIERLLADAQDPRPAIHRSRLVKDASEVAALRRAIELTGQGIVEAMRSAEPGMYEYELEAVAEYMWRRGAAEREGFDSIVGSGPNSCVLHYRANRRRTGPGELVVMDVGAEVLGYTADVTRTFPVGGRFSERQKELYLLVRRAQEAAIALCRPGRTVADVHQAASRVLADAGHADHFWHGTSHWLGLDVHDVGDYSTPLAPGMVLTVEPGLYFSDEAIGIRIEDDVLVTDTDPVVLSAAIPSTPEEIESLMAQDGIGNVRR